MCACGSSVQYSGVTEHCKTKKHLKYLKDNPESIEQHRLWLQAVRMCYKKSEDSTTIDDLTWTECCSNDSC